MPLPLKRFGFLIALVFAIAAAFFAPSIGSSGGSLGSQWLGDLGIWVIFFNLGLLLKTEQLAADLRDWQLHLLVHSILFFFFPVCVLLIFALAGDLIPDSLKLGMLYLAVLPTTISTSSVFTMQAGGNVPAAVFNSTLSNILAVLLVPAWMSWQLAGTAGATADLGPLFLKIGMLVIAPLIVGQSVRPAAGTVAANNRHRLTLLNNSIILLLVYRAFCQSVAGGLWSDSILPELLVAVVLCGVLHAAMSAGAWGSANMLRFDRAARICALFSGSHKSLATGVAMSGALAGAFGDIDAGMMLLPVLVYASIQLSAGSIIAGHLARTEH